MLYFHVKITVLPVKKNNDFLNVIFKFECFNLLEFELHINSLALSN